MAPKKAPPFVAAVPKKAPPLVVPVPKKAPPPFAPLSFVVRKWLIFVLKLRDVAFTYWWEAAKETAKHSEAMVDINSSVGIAVRLARH